MHSRSRRSRQPQVSPAPRWLVVLGLVGAAYLLGPLLAMAALTPWSRVGPVLTQESSVAALWLSLRTCLVAVLVDLVVGVPLAVLLSRQWRAVGLARVLVALPLSLPPVVAGIALLRVFGRQGALGPWLETIGVQVAFSTAAVVMAQVFVSLPFLVITLEAALRARPSGLEQTAAALGAGPSRVLVTITIPMVLPGLARGTALALARCLGEFGATLTFAGSLQGVTRTLPLQVYLARESDSGTALVLGMLLVVLAAAVVTVTEWRGRACRRSKTVPWAATLPERPRQPRPAAAASVSGTVPERGWELDLELPAGQVVAVMGPNGAGKSTLAEALAGGLALATGQISIAGRVVDGPGRFVTARHRRVAVVSQQPRLFPHLSVLANVAYPLGSRGVRRAVAQQKALAELATVGCADLAGRLGSELSGGQAARVALARALVFEPDLLVLDEPTAALDVDATTQVLGLLLDRLRATPTTTVLITHDPLTALQLADQMVVLDHGRIVDRGAPAVLLAQPRSRFTAQLAGLNIVSGPAVERPDGLPALLIGDRQLVAAADSRLSAGTRRWTMAFPPEAVSLYREAVPGSPRSVLPARVLGSSVVQGLVSASVALADGSPVTVRITLSAWTELGVSVGSQVWCSVKATQVQVLRADRPQPRPTTSA